LKTNFIKGIFKGLLYYAIGFILAWLTYLIFGWEYKHAPGLHHIIGILFLLGGAGWTLYNFVLLMTGLKSKVNFGILTIHITTIFAVVLFIAISISTDDVTETKTDPKSIITINKNDRSNEASIVDGNGDTLFSKKGDTILIDNIPKDSTNYR
jgi:hypothetical protein